MFLDRECRAAPGCPEGAKNTPESRIRHIDVLHPDGSLAFYCTIAEGLVLHEYNTLDSTAKARSFDLNQFKIGSRQRVQWRDAKF